MAMRINSITFDCADPYRLVGFWAEATGFREDPDYVNGPGELDGLLIAPDRSLRLLFMTVPEGKTAKNRVHLDFAPTDRTRDAEVDRLLAIGAEIVADHREDGGAGWVILADPEGNEFCVARSDEERAAQAA
jgi:catechol 2,3-dioxygenase-like lactoylglutathione lyase family enzyme